MNLIDRVVQMNKQRVEDAEIRYKANIAKAKTKIEKEQAKVALQREKVALQQELMNAKKELKQSKQELAESRRSAGVYTLREKVDRSGKSIEKASRDVAGSQFVGELKEFGKALFKADKPVRRTPVKRKPTARKKK